MAELNFHIILDTENRDEILNIRDEIVDHLTELNYRLSSTHDGTEIYMCAKDVLTAGEWVTGVTRP